MADDGDGAEVEIVDLPNLLKEKVGPGDAAMDLDAIARAEAALDGLRDEWQGWLEQDVAALLAAQGRFHREGYSDAVAEDLHRTAHDLKGLAPTYEYPLVGRIAASLCRALIRSTGTGGPPRAVVDAHVDAIRAAIHDGIRDETAPHGAAVIAALSALNDKQLG